MTISRHHLAAACVSLCLAASFATPAFAAGQADVPSAPAHEHDGGGHHGHGMPGADMHGPGMDVEGMHERMLGHLRRLNLSEAQRDKLFAIMHAAAPEWRDHAKAIRKAHEALRELGHAERFDDARANALSRELGQAVAAEALLRARTEAQVFAVLTPDQRERLRRHRTPGPQLRPGQQGWQGQPGQPVQPGQPRRP